MNQFTSAEEGPCTTRIPADISRPDRLIGPFTARQAAVLAAVGVVLYAGWWATRPLMAPLVYLAMVVPVAGAASALVLGRREGIGLDRFLLAALAHRRRPKRQVYAPDGVPPLPALVPGRWAAAAGPPPAAMAMPYAGVSADGVLDLGREGTAAVATCSTVNFELRSAAEQQQLTAAFARWLNSLTGPVQLLVRCHRIDLTPLADQLHQDAAGLPHPALEQAARAHADFLSSLATGGNLLGRQTVLVSREPAGRAGRAVQRTHEAARALGGAEITVTPLNATATAALITGACNPDAPTLPDPSEGDRP